ncbi:MAG: hypothetical protein P1V18_04735 [Candidatus Gracilibacteria bacterium]|nr:hypothetical protein [Candidatus Gracilibacteria bacterium]
MEEFQAHNPSRWSVVIVFMVIFGLIGGIFYWAFFLNIGSVVVSASRDFQLLVDDDVLECPLRCQIELPVGSHQFVASVEGYYNETFKRTIVIGDRLEVELDFHLIPYLKDEVDFPETEEEDEYILKASSIGKDLVRISSGERLVSFESLKNPVLDAGGNIVSVVDEERLFLVNVENKRRRRLFDDSVLVQQALVSDGGERVLLHVVVDQQSQMWVWEPSVDALTPLSEYEKMDRVVWFPGEDYKLLMVVDDVELYKDGGLLDDLVASVSGPEPVVGLISFNLDTLEAEILNEFEIGAPTRIIRLSDGVFLEYSASEYQELVVRE